MDVFAALADPLRRELLVQLSRGSARVVDLAEAHPVSRPAISRHLRVLTEAGLVDADELGRERHYRLRAEPLAEVRTFVTELMRHPRVPERSLDALATEVRRTTRDRRRAAAAEITRQEDTA